MLLVSNPQLCYFTDTADHGVKVTSAAGIGVVERPESVLRGFVGVELYDCCIMLGLGSREAICQVIKGCKSFRGARRGYYLI